MTCRHPLRSSSPRHALGRAVSAIALGTTLMTAGIDAGAALATVQQPRAFGYVLGDLFSQAVLVERDADASGLATPLSTGRVSIWLERRPPRIRTDADGRRWLIIDYQVMNAPRALTTITTPALSLHLKTGATLNVAPSPLSIGPLTQEAPGPLSLPALRPDRRPPLVPTTPIRRALVTWLVLTAGVALAWLGWWVWRNKREAANLPFARAWDRLRRRDASALDTDAVAWRCVHRALNDTAGQVVHANALHGLFERAPYLQPLKPDLQRFYECSSARFFKHSPPQEPFALLELCRALYRAEKRHRR